MDCLLLYYLYLLLSQACPSIHDCALRLCEATTTTTTAIQCLCRISQCTINLCVGILALLLWSSLIFFSFLSSISSSFIFCFLILDLYISLFLYLSMSQDSLCSSSPFLFIYEKYSPVSLLLSSSFHLLLYLVWLLPCQ